MLPFGPLDGRTVRAWSTAAFAAAFVASAVAAAVAILFVGFPY
jgi:Zn-dependent protease